MTAIPCRIKHLSTQEGVELEIRGRSMFLALHKKVQDMTNDTLAVAIAANVSDSGKSLEQDWKDYLKDAGDHFLKATLFKKKEDILQQVG